jgi:hypothetical protein
VVLLEEGEDVDEVHAVDRVAADPDAGALTESGVGGLMHRFVGQRAGARDDTNLAGTVTGRRHDAHLALAGGDDARAVRTD